MLGLLLRAMSIIAEIFILISHLQRLLSMFEQMSIFFDRKTVIDDCAKDGGKEFFTEMLCILKSNSYRTQCILVKNSLPPSLAQSPISAPNEIFFQARYKL